MFKFPDAVNRVQHRILHMQRRDDSHWVILPTMTPELNHNRQHDADGTNDSKDRKAELEKQQIL